MARFTQNTSMVHSQLNL